MRVETTRAVRTHRGFGCGAALATAVTVFLVVSLVSTALFLLAPAGNNAAASFLRPQPGSLRWDQHERITVLIMGTTSRASSAASTEMMTVASFDPLSRSLTLLSIPSTLWVTIPGFGQAPVSDAYADGGPRLALLTVEGLTRVAIPYYLLLNADALQHLVDDVGGLSVRVNGRSHRMDGEATARYIAAPSSDQPSDVDRMRRELLLLSALGHALSQPQTFLQLPTIINTLGGTIPTNVPYDQIPALVRAVSAVHPDRVHLAMMDYADAAVTRYTGAEQVLLPDPQHVHTLAQRLFPDFQLRHAPAIDVFNGGEVPGQAANVAAWLRGAGVRVQTVASANSFNYSHTQVLLRPSAVSSAMHLARVVAAVLQAPLVYGSAPGSHSPVAVIIGHDFQDPAQQ